MRKGEKVYIINKSYRNGLNFVVQRLKKYKLYNQVEIRTDGGGSEITFNAFIGYWSYTRIMDKKYVHVIDYKSPPVAGDFYLRQDFFTTSEAHEIHNFLPEELFEI